MRNKRGQFYLFAAIIIITLIIGYAAVSNYAKKDSTKVYNLKEELGIESEMVLDFGILKSDEINNEELIEHFTTLYAEFAGDEKEIYYIFGNSEKIIAYKYGDIVEGVITINIGDSSAELTIDKKVKEDIDVEQEGNKIILTIEDNKYEFDLKPGDNFYFIISEKIGDETHVAAG